MKVSNADGSESSSGLLPSEEDIAAARAEVSRWGFTTPLVRFRHPDIPPEQRVYLKLETLQPNGSFKIRPAAAALASLLASRDAEAAAELRVVTASAGNFAQGLAYVCREKGVPVTVVVPEGAPEAKLRRIGALGATVLSVSRAEWWQCIVTHEAPQAPGHVFVHPGEHRACIAGNGTMAREILEQLPQVDAIVAPFGSGALCCGLAAGAPDVAVYSCEPAMGAPMAASLAAGERTSVAHSRSLLVDGCGSAETLPRMYPLASRLLCGALAVSDAHTARAMRALVQDACVVAEGAGAISLGAMMAGMLPPDKTSVVCVISGGCIDTQTLLAVLSQSPLPTTTTTTADAVVEERLDFDTRLAALQLPLPRAPQEKGTYRAFTISRGMLYTSGHGPVLADGVSYQVGRIPGQLSVQQGVEAARSTAYAVLSTLVRALGSLNGVARLVKVLGMVNADPERISALETVTIINGFSEVMVQVFGEDRGVGARSAVGVATLPMNTPVEIEAIFELV